MDEPNIDDLVAEMRAEVEQRRLAGDYPLGLESQLDHEFTWLLDQMARREVSTERLESLVWRVGQLTDAIGSAPPTDSKVPGGAAAHRALNTVSARASRVLADETRQLGQGIVQLGNEIVELFQAQRSADERMMVDVLSSLLDRVAVIDALSATVVELERRVRALEGDHGER